MQAGVTQRKWTVCAKARISNLRCNLEAATASGTFGQCVVEMTQKCDVLQSFLQMFCDNAFSSISTEDGQFSRFIPVYSENAEVAGLQTERKERLWQRMVIDDSCARSFLPPEVFRINSTVIHGSNYIALAVNGGSRQQ